MSRFDCAALVVVDVQIAIDADYHAAQGPRNNPAAELVIAGLLDLWRSKGRPVIHVRHDSTSLDSAYRPGQIGNEFKPEVTPQAGETVLPKQTNNAFIGTDFDAMLHARGIKTLVITGVATNNSVEATVRMAGNLGYQTFLVEDACFTFARADYRGRHRTADEVHDMTLANLDSEYCSVISAAFLFASR